MPPQLRASAFFDLPSEPQKIDIKDGSAMNTLDSLLDASAAAPVSAFTDHVFAGKLGAEVYGPEKKRKVKKAQPTATPTPGTEEKVKRKTLVKRNSGSNMLDAAEDKPKRKTLVKRNSNGNLLDPNPEKKRASRFSLFGPKPADDDSDDDARPKSAPRSVDDDARSHRSASPDPDVDEETETESEDEAPVYQGPPTTLLAELQLRKQQDKLRTRPVYHTEGMRSTLLELDAVAQVERKARHGKRVQLAWEDPSATPQQDEEDDEEVPLGMLFAAKAAAPGGSTRLTMDISMLMSEMHRPLGLMERREIEENEPLSRRRDRLQGRVEEQVPNSLAVFQQRMSHMPGGMGMRSQSRLTLPLPQPGGSRAGSMLGSRPGSAAEGSEPEVEGETLAARRARLAAENPLPRTRPVSSSFTAELLREFGPGEGGDAQKLGANLTHSRAASRDTTGGAGIENGAAVPEEEETLGQRRRRLQREREAREREMAFSTLNRAATPVGPRADAPRPSAPVGMAGVLGAVGPGGAMMMDPREQERLRREAEGARHRQDMDIKMAAMRAQMPTSLTAPSVGGHAGGYLGGRFNDGGGGTGAQSGLGYGGVGGGLLGMHQQQRSSTLLGAQGMSMGQGAYGGSTPNLGMYQNGAAASMSVNTIPLQGAGYPMAMPIGPGGQGHMDMVERWRQGVMP
jgi:hypothetical protein